MIIEFQGYFRWLSNFSLVRIERDGYVFPSVEHAYMAAKSEQEWWKRFCSDENNTAGQVKKASRNIELVPNWEDLKLEVMRDCLEQKFQDDFYKEKLLATGDMYIQEGNLWGDKFWGVCLRTGVGQNKLGFMIMEIRDKLKL